MLCRSINPGYLQKTPVFWSSSKLQISLLGIFYYFQDTMLSRIGSLQLPGHMRLKSFIRNKRIFWCLRFSCQGKQRDLKLILSTSLMGYSPGSFNICFLNSYFLEPRELSYFYVGLCIEETVPPYLWQSRFPHVYWCSSLFHAAASFIQDGMLKNEKFEKSCLLPLIPAAYQLDSKCHMTDSHVSLVL